AAAQADVRLEPPFDRVQAELIEPIGFDPENAVVAELAEWAAAPQAQRLGEEFARAVQVASAGRIVAVADQPLEATSVDSLRRRLERIARGRAANVGRSVQGV